MLTTYTIPDGVRGCRADKILAAAFNDYSRTALQRAFDAGLVKRGEVALGRDALVTGGDQITFTFPETKAAELRPVDIPLDILFEDKHLLAINKTSGMVVHPGAATGEATLVHALLAHCAGSLSGIGGVERPGIVHRLDRETSGIILVAKTDKAHRGLATQFAERAMQKEYLALVAGAPALISGSIRKAIGRNKHHRHKMAVIEVEQGGREAHTDWVAEEKFGDVAALIRCTLHSGRTHQIRVHLKALGHVLLGDDIYGWKPDPRLPRQPERVMLHAEHLVFEHPITKKTVDLRAPLPADFVATIAMLKKVASAGAKAKRLLAKPVKLRKKPVPPAHHEHESRK